jgi:hypothetical protein
VTSADHNKENAHKRDRVSALLGAPLLLPGEDRTAYDDLLAAVIATMQPSDVLEQIWTHESVEKQWEALRGRRLKIAFIAAGRQKALAAILHPLRSNPRLTVNDDEAQQLAWKFTLGHQDVIQEVEALLSKAKLPVETVYAQAMALNIHTLEIFDRLIWAAESRRDACLREIEYHRASFGQKLRRAMAQVDVAEVRQIESPPEHKNQAA